MIKRYRITLSHDGSQYLGSGTAYPLYSELLKLASEELAESIHNGEFTPVSQYVRRLDENHIMWTVTLFGEHCINELGRGIEGLSELDLENIGVTLHTDDILGEPEITFQEIIAAASQSEELQRYEMKFLTPTGFKSGGQYVLFPSSELILKSLISKWGQACENFDLDDEDMKKMLLDGVRISGYRLSDTGFRLKGQRIQSFIGSVDLSTRLPAPLMQIYKSLMIFGQYSGVGIKTALGMGGVNITMSVKG